MARLGKEMGAAAAALLVAAAFAAPSVEVTNVQQQYPWTNTVDITYTVQGVNLTHQTNRTDHIVNDTYFVTFEAKNGNTAIKDVNGNSVFTNALVNGNGTFTAQWQPQTNLQLTGNNITPSVFRGEENAYLVVNLETNKTGKFDCWFEPMSTQEASNERYNKEEYKTKKLVLRRVPAGTYTIGGPEAIFANSYGTNSEHQVVIGKDYYIGIFELTVAQYELLDKGKIVSTTGIDYPKAASYVNIRGGASPNAVPGTGIIATLSTNTWDTLKGHFDLPTESMWEVAARAQSNKKWLSGDTNARMKEYANYAGSGSRGLVGRLKPNPWGLYDIFGNVWEQCRDYANQVDLKTLQPNGLMPIATGDANKCSYRGGSIDGMSNWFRFSNRHWNMKNGGFSNVGMRLSYIVP